MNATDLSKHVNAEDFLKQLTQTRTVAAVEQALKGLPIVDEQAYLFDEKEPTKGWKEGHLHWIPLGRKRGATGQVTLGKGPVPPLAERLVNGMEALIELMRQRELLSNPSSIAPANPREAALRYFGIPPLDHLPLCDKKDPRRQTARELARRLKLQLSWDKKAREFAVQVSDQGIGQPPSRVHETLLSLGSSDKGDKPYLIGLFGQGGSSTFQASKYSWIVSRRAPDLLGGEEDGVGFSVVKRIFPKGRRDNYFAYLASHPDGRVPRVSASAAKAIGLEHGSWFTHIAYDFAQGGTAVTHGLYRALNHVLYNPILPFDTDVTGTAATIYGNGYRLSNVPKERKDLDKAFGPQPIV